MAFSLFPFFNAQADADFRPCLLVLQLTRDNSCEPERGEGYGSDKTCTENRRACA